MVFGAHCDLWRTELFSAKPQHPPPDFCSAVIIVASSLDTKDNDIIYTKYWNNAGKRGSSHVPVALAESRIFCQARGDNGALNCVFLKIDG